LPRLIPADLALDMIAGGKPVSASKALEIGLIDEIADDVHAAAKTLALDAARTGIPVPLTERPARPPTDADAFDAQKATIRAKARGQLSPVAAIDAVERSLTLSTDAAFDAEREAFIRFATATSPQPSATSSLPSAPSPACPRQRASPPAPSRKSASSAAAPWARASPPPAFWRTSS
jgi:enoyl-CoA hydratase/carnithine racemase